MAGLPRDMVDSMGHMRCPWCGADTEDARLSLGQLAGAFLDGDLSYAKRSPDGAALGSAIVCDCPGCSRPFAVALQERRWRGEGIREVRLLAVRTETDLKLIEGGGAG